MKEFLRTTLSFLPAVLFSLVALAIGGFILTLVADDIRHRIKQRTVDKPVVRTGDKADMLKTTLTKNNGQLQTVCQPTGQQVTKTVYSPPVKPKPKLETEQPRYYTSKDFEGKIRTDRAVLRGYLKRADNKLEYDTNPTLDTLYQIDIAAPYRKGDGSNWDVFSGQPDLAFRSGNHLYTGRNCHDTYSCRAYFLSSKNAEKWRLELYDADIAIHDGMSAGIIELGKKRKLWGGASVTVRRVKNSGSPINQVMR